MQQVQIDSLGFQPPQAALARLGNALAAGVVRVDLADEKDPVALAGDGITHHDLGAAFGVHFCGVDQGHAQVDAQAQGGDFLFMSGGVFAHLPGALADHGHLGAGQLLGAHACSF
ncbi:hypothetical protein D3C76_1251590 [compost metagenome]